MHLVNLNEDDLLLIAQKSAVVSNSYDNKNITIKQLVEELRLDYAVQEGSVNPPARHGVVMPGRTMTYDYTTGVLDVNFDTQGLTFVDYIQNDASLTGPNSIPDKPTGNETPGSFYIIGDRDVKLSGALWGIGAYETVVKDRGLAYKTNNGNINILKFEEGPVLNVKLAITNGVATSVFHNNQNTDDLTQFTLGQTLTPYLESDGSGSSGEKPLLQVKSINSQTGFVDFDIIRGGSKIHTKESTGQLTGVRAIPVDSSLPDYGVVVDVTLTDSEITQVDKSYYVKGYELGTTLKVIGINKDSNGDFVESGTVRVQKEQSSGGTDEISTFLNDRVVLTLDGWKIIDDTLAREAVHELKADDIHIVDVTDDQGDVNTIEVVQFTDISTPDEPKEVSLKILNATEDNDGLFPKEFFNKINGIPDAYGEAHILNELKILSPDYDDPADKTYFTNTKLNPVRIQKFVDGQPQFEPDGTPIYEEGIVNYDIGVFKTRETVDGTDEDGVPNGNEGRVHGTVFIPTQVELDGDESDPANPIDPTDFAADNVKYYSCVPNINTAEKRYLKVTGKKYVIIQGIKRVIIEGPTTTNKDTTSDVIFTCSVTPDLTSPGDAEYEWEVNGIVDISSNSNTLTVGNDTLDDGMNEITCTVNLVGSTDEVSELHYIYAIPASAATPFTTTETGPNAINGYYPLYDLEESANSVGDGTSHTHEFDGVTYYMPNGVEFFHGDYGTTDTSSGGSGY